MKMIPTCCTNFTPRNIKYGRNMTSKLDEITAKLQDLVDQRKDLGLDVTKEGSNRKNRRLEQTSLVDESKIMGREGDKDALIRKLLGNEACNDNVSIVSIVGMGGIGKTTLAKVLYNDEKVNDHFELRAWVCVSEEFDVFSISKAIFQAVNGEDKSFANLDLLQVALKEKLTKKRFLLVLDNVWNEDNQKWELLQSPFVAGAPGSKVIVTTRKMMVASVMDSVEAYNLNVLSDDKALSLFAQYALGEEDFEKHQMLKLHAEGIVKKCGRLPLALITLGRVLKTKRNEDEWQELLNSEIWNLQDEKEILPALRLSYYDLPSHLKQLFAYCSFFPKDYKFDKNDLVLLWMAEGFLSISNGLKSMESLGHDYFEELKSRSFFQHSTDDESRYTMHDLINDLAISVAGEFFFMFDDKMNVAGRNEAFEKFRHFSFIGGPHGVYGKVKELQRARCLRTFLPISTYEPWDSYISLSNSDLVELLPRLQFLRVLSLAYCSITEVPPSIGDLKHMRYLNFSRTEITCLPEEVGDLYNLQSLLLFGCHELCSLAFSFVKLQNLRHLDIRRTPLKKMPFGIGGSSSLQTLPRAIIEGPDDGFKISELKELSNLRGQLFIQGLHNVINAEEAKDANLQLKKGVDALVLQWSHVFDVSRNETSEYEVLEELSPHHMLKELEIEFYGGMEFPSWVRSPSFGHLTKLTLRDCRSCINLPKLEHLRSLRDLTLSGMHKVLEFYVPVDASYDIAFPCLEYLRIRDMECLEKWSTGGGDKGVSFPRLHHLTINGCPKLAHVSVGSMPSLSYLRIDGPSEAALRSLIGMSQSIVELHILNIKGLSHLDEDVSKHLEAVEKALIADCEELRYAWEESEACKFLVSLKELHVSRCRNLVSLGVSMKSIREMSFSDCDKLESFVCASSTEKLHMDNCPSMTSLTFSPVPSSSLKYLYIKKCDNLRWFHGGGEGCLVNLMELMIYNCDKIESIPEKVFGFRNMSCLIRISIRECKNMKSFPHEHLQSLTCLEYLSVSMCPSMDYSFPSGSWPPNLRSLTIGDLKKPMAEWGNQNYPTSLVYLMLNGHNSGVVSFVVENGGASTTAAAATSSWFLLPSSLTLLEICEFEDVESLSEEVLQHLTCLEHLYITSCPKIKDPPQTTSSLTIYNTLIKDFNVN